MKDHGFALNPQQVRVDFFKPSGKWYTTEVLLWTEYEGYIVDIFHDLLDIQFSNYYDYTAVCLHPYHEHSYPLIRKPKETK